MHSLGRCCSCNHSEHKTGNFCIREGKIPVLGLLSRVKGPWALIYWQSHSRTLWFGRDAFGRRSLLVHWPTSEDPRFLLSSVSTPSSINKSADSEVENGSQDLDFWEELSCGIYSLTLNDSKLSRSLVGELRKYEWTNPALNELIRWERISVDCNSHEIDTVKLSAKRLQNIANATSSNGIPSSTEVSLVNGITTCEVSLPARKVLIALKESVRQRTIISPIIENRPVPVAVLFSGGLDSMILAALLDECLDPSYGIDLLNVSFDEQLAPDRISARAGVKELQNISPSRRWNLVEIDSDLSNLITETEHVMSLISPSKTYMDLNIGIALWLAAGGDGWVYTNSQRLKYKSDAKILLVGSGADEQCAGYSRHRTKFRLGSWLGLHEEMKLDMQRIWKRNLGRDDRCISDTGKEARFPFLDEDVIKTLLEIPLWEVADLNLPVGKGDKKILREVAQLLGLKEAAFLPKRAIQFGSRIARESNRKNFGSNRAANQASAGSVVIPSTI
ncbi:hypothetical protein ACHQM5_008888 [Ranunculus cassubicifolius]